LPRYGHARIHRTAVKIIDMLGPHLVAVVGSFAQRLSYQ